MTTTRRHQKGQVLLEFVGMLSMLLGISVVLLMFLAAFSEYGWRLLQLIGFEYP
jgi:hypothetical protein